MDRHCDPDRREKKHKSSVDTQKRVPTIALRLRFSFGAHAKQRCGPATVKKILLKRSTIMTVTPLNDRLLVKRIDEEQKSAGGIIIPDSAKEKPLEGKVVAVGPGKWEEGERRPLDVAAGDRILFGKYGGTEIKIDGEEHLILREDEVLATIVE